MRRRHREIHPPENAGWLRAAVLGANDGIVSTASLIVGIAAADAARGTVLATGVAGLVAGAMSMAAGEYVSVSSQADAEAADRVRETEELAEHPEAEREELIGIYQSRGLDRPLAEQVADHLTRADALAAHMRDELGLSAHNAARPVQAAIASALSFSVGAALPLAAVLATPHSILIPAVSVASLAFLGALGALAAWAGRAPIAKAVVRVVFWGAFALAVTAGVGNFFGVA